MKKRLLVRNLRLKTDFVGQIYRSSHPDVFLAKVVLKICSKFTGEHPCRRAISIKLVYWNRTSAWVFSRRFAAYFQNTYPRNTSGWLLLDLEVLLHWIMVMEKSCSQWVWKLQFWKVENRSKWSHVAGSKNPIDIRTGMCKRNDFKRCVTRSHFLLKQQRLLVSTAKPCTCIALTTDLT